MDIHHSNHSALVTHARKLIERSKGLLNQSSASTFLGTKHYEPFSDVLRSAKVPSLRVIDGGQSRADREPSSVAMEWQATRTAPFCRDLQLAVIDAGGIHALVFPCRRILRGWVKAETNERVYVRPTHWRGWKDSYSALFSVVSSIEQGSKL